MTPTLQPDIYDNGHIPPPYFLHQPTRIAAPIVLMVPHSGRYYPADLRSRSPLKMGALRLSEDCWVDRLFAPAAALGLPMIVASHARIYADLNRRPDELDPTMFSPKLPPTDVHKSRRVEAGLGVIPRLVAKGLDLYDQRLPANDAARRLNDVYRPYHRAVETLVEQVRAQFGYAVLIDAHSMPSTSVTADGRVGPVAQMVIGDNWSRSADQRVTAVIESQLIQARLRVRRNVPYAGGFITEHYGRPDDNIHCIQIETCRSLYMHERSYQLHDGFTSLQEKLTEVIGQLIDRVPKLGLEPTLSHRSRWAAE